MYTQIFDKSITILSFTVRKNERYCQNGDLI